MMERFSLSELKSMPTISVGHTEELKVQNDGIRVWFSRMTTEDGAPYNNQVIVERNDNGRWVKVDEYEAK